MKKSLISSFDDFQKMLPNNIDLGKDATRAAALKRYLSKGGVVHVVPFEGSWPKLLYPTRAHLKKKIDDTRVLQQQYSERLDSWQRKFSKAKSYHSFHNLKKLKEPLYWKHMAKCAIDKDYKSDSEKVSLPAHLVGDPRWKPMVKTFLSDSEYRKQLVQTVDESIVYRKNKSVAQYANQLQSFRVEQSNRKVEELRQRVEALEADISAMEELSKWASC